MTQDFHESYQHSGFLENPPAWEQTLEPLPQ
jgi:hypothetical protein